MIIPILFFIIIKTQIQMKDFFLFRYYHLNSHLAVGCSRNYQNLGLNFEILLYACIFGCYNIGFSINTIIYHNQNLALQYIYKINHIFIYTVILIVTKCTFYDI
jgi:hypothetical protein